MENLLFVTTIDEEMLVTKTSSVQEERLDTVLVKFFKHYPNQQVEVSIPEEFLSIPMDAIFSKGNASLNRVRQGKPRKSMPLP